MNFGRQIAQTGAFVFEDPLLPTIDLDSRQALFLNRVASDVTGAYARFPGGFVIPDIASAEVSAGFSPLFPVMIALFYELSGLRAALLVAPLFAILSVCAVYVAAARLGSTRTGLVAASVLALSLPQIWFAKFSMPAVVAEFFVWAGLVTLFVSLDRPHPLLSGVAGWLLGLATLAKFDLLAVLPVSILAVWTAHLFSGSRRRRQHLVYFSAFFAIPICHYAIHLLVFPSHYVLFLEHTLRTSYPVELFGQLVGNRPAVILVVMVSGLLALLIGRAAKGRIKAVLASRAWAWLLLALLLGYSVNDVVTADNRLWETVPWLGWYLSWPILALLPVAVLALCLRQTGHTTYDLRLACLLLLLGSACLHYLYDPHEPTEHIWSIRRFLPVVILTILVLVALAVVDVLNRIRRPHRWWVSGTVIAALLGLVVQPSIPILGKPLWGQALDTSKELATLFPDRPVVLVSPELAGTHIQTSLAYLHDVDAILVTREYANPARKVLERVIVTMLEHGRRVCVLLGAEGFHFEAPSLLLSSPRALNVDLLTLETTRSRVPAAVGVRSTAMTVFQATLRTTSKTTTLHVGTVAEDTLFQLRGFYGAETDPDVGTFRWSGAVATIVIPAESKIRLVLGGGRPEGVAPATVTISVDGQARIRDVVLPNTATTVTLANPRAVDGGRTTITIESTVFNPGELALSDDGRSLGVMLYRVEFADTRR